MSSPMVRSSILHPSEQGLTVIQRLIDPALIVASYFVSHLALTRQGWTDANTIAAAVSVVSFIVAAELSGLYRSWRGAPLRQGVVQVFTAWMLSLPAMLFLAFVTKSTGSYSRIVTTVWFGAAPSVMVLFRVAFRTALRELRARGYNRHRVALAGATPIAGRLARMIADHPAIGLQIYGIYDDRNRRRDALASELAEHRGSLADLVEHARNGHFDTVFITLPLRAEPRITRLVGELADTTVTVHIVPEFHAYDLLHARWSTVGDMQIVSIFDSPFHGLGGWVKRVEDLVLGGLILCLIALPMLAIGIAVKLDSKGPILFRQRRYGLNGKPIYVLKFRTMTVCEDGDQVTQAKAGDKRFTRLGQFLRRTSLDELPQFLNVLKGDMSIVGPRPHAIAHNELYRGKIHGYMLRHKVKPGITGWAQVNGWRGETDTIEKMERRIEHDLYYIHNWRLDWDLRIVWMTVFGRATRQNAV